MVTMVDELFDRTYQSGRASLNDGLRAVFAGIGDSFKVLHKIEWSAPWTAPRKPARRV